MVGPSEASPAQSLAESVAEVSAAASRLARADQALAAIETALSEYLNARPAAAAGRRYRAGLGVESNSPEALLQWLNQIDAQTSHEGVRFLSSGCEVSIADGWERTLFRLPPLSIYGSLSAECGRGACRSRSESQPTAGGRSFADSLTAVALSETRQHRHQLSIFADEVVGPALARLQASLENVAAAQQTNSDLDWAASVADVSPVDVLLATSRSNLHVNGPTVFLEDGTDHLGNREGDPSDA